MAEGNSLSVIMKSESPAGRVVVLNGGSSAGKTTIGRKLQNSLTETWLLIGVDVLIWLLPIELVNDPRGLLIENGVIQRSAEFMRLSLAFQHAVAEIARSGVNVIVDDLMNDGMIDRQRWDEALAGLDSLWVGVHCDATIANSREKKRGDRPRGLARRTSTSCHQDIDYDVEVDTGVMDLDAAVNHILRGLSGRWPMETSSTSNGPTAQPPVSAWTKDGGVSRSPWEH